MWTHRGTGDRGLTMHDNASARLWVGRHISACGLVFEIVHYEAPAHTFTVQTPRGRASKVHARDLRDWVTAGDVHVLAPEQLAGPPRRAGRNTHTLNRNTKGST